MARPKILVADQLYESLLLLFSQIVRKVYMMCDSGSSVMILKVLHSQHYPMVVRLPKMIVDLTHENIELPQ